MKLKGALTNAGDTTEMQNIGHLFLRASQSLHKCVPQQQCMRWLRCGDGEKVGSWWVHYLHLAGRADAASGVFHSKQPPLAEIAVLQN